MTGFGSVGTRFVATLLLVATLQTAPAWAACKCSNWRMGGSAISFTQSNGILVRLVLDVKGSNLAGYADYGFGAENVKGTVHGQVISGRPEFHVRWNNGRVSQYYLFIDNDGFVLGWGNDRLRPAEVITIRGTRRLECAPEVAPAEILGLGMENDTNRALSDYDRFELEGRTPDVCQNACLANPKKCRAWAYVRPGFQGPKALCYLKHSVPAPFPDKCCISGVAPSRAPEQQTRGPGIAPQTPPLPMAPERQEVPVPAVTPRGSIGDKYARLGGVRGAMGPPTSEEADAPHGGRCRQFQHGMICLHPQIGEAFGVWGSVGEKWAHLGRAEFGYPITDETPTRDGRGRFNHFRGMQYPGRPESSIFWSPQTGAHAIYGLIRDAWAKQGWERGPLGYPTSDEYQDGKFRRVNFERGFMRWAPDTGIQIVQ